MFYCDTCAAHNEWPQSFMKSRGKCEMCDTVAVCNDIPSSALPLPKRQESQEGIEAKQKLTEFTRLATQANLCWYSWKASGTDEDWKAMRKAQKAARKARKEL